MAGRYWKLAIFMCLPSNFVFRNSFQLVASPEKLAEHYLWPIQSTSLQKYQK